MMLSYLFMAILAANLYNQANSAGLPKPQLPPPIGQSLSRGPPNEYHEDNNKNLEHKIETLIESMTRMENSIQNLQEKSHTWSIFQHHIASWNDGLRILENKLDFLKRSQEEQQLAWHKMTDVMTTPPDTTVINEIKDTLKRDQLLQKESATKVNSILRQLQSMHRDKVGHSNAATNGRKKSNLMAGDTGSSYCNGSHKLEQRLNSIHHQMALQKDLKQLHSMDKRMGKTIENLSQSMAHALDKQEELSVRLQRSNECCYALSSELTTFTESSDILLKRIERLLKNVNDKLNRLHENTNQEDQEQEGEVEVEGEHDHNNSNNDDELLENTTQRINLDDVFHEEEGESQGHHVYEEVEEKDVDGEEENHISGNISDEHDENNNNEAGHTELYGHDIEFLRPDLSGCHELTAENGVDETLRIDGIYKFAHPEINEFERDFNERLCIFPPPPLPLHNKSDSAAARSNTPWTVIQQRMLTEHPENFNRSWSEYRNGFGSLQREFWFGNEFIHRLVYNDDYELRIELEDFNNSKVYAEYGVFRIDSEEFNYNLLIGEYDGTASTVGDAMKYHNDNDFSTYDRRNDKTVDACCSCALGYGSGWWFDNCSEANLNGIYRFTPWGNNYNGIMWELWHGDYSLKSTRMMIRPKQSNNANEDSALYSSTSYDDLEQDHQNEDP
ncbi:fibroleukin-like [Musca vetustissima]|uniref:fibroleukin-like n=1 Tax=Musca vetustissima TaxID=27455 RepID=UPI002AB69220|nr:fibroleukin-like [Musca vetustissima]